jgi:alpha-N-arabinofuranosidase
MANIAQVVNVLQAMILTHGEKMVLTPSYHVFEMYKVHQDATRVPVELEAPEYKLGEQSMPSLSVSASRDEGGRVHVSIVNVHAKRAVELSCEVQGIEATSVRGSILTADELDAHNTFDSPDRVKPQAFEVATMEQSRLRARIPPRSVLILAVESNSR